MLAFVFHNKLNIIMEGNLGALVSHHEYRVKPKYSWLNY